MGSPRGMARSHPVSPRRRRITGAVTICIPMTAAALSYGALAHAAGLQAWQTAILAAFALGGAAEILFVSTLLAGGAPLTAAVSGILVNTRNVAFGMSVGSYLPTGWRRWFGAHLVNDETTAFSRLEDNDRDRWRSFSLLGVMMLVSWVVGAVAGTLLAGRIDTVSLGIDAAFPVLLIAMILDDLRHRPMLLTGLLGAVIALGLTPWLPAGIGGVTALLALLAWPLTGRGHTSGAVA